MKSHLGELTDEAIIYQLEKVDSGGAVMELFEEHMNWLSAEWGFPFDIDEGVIILPDGRKASLTFEAFITKGE